MRKVLITGASGLLGKSLLRVLREKYEYDVYAVTTKAEKLKDYKYVNVIECNLLDAKETEKIIENVMPDIVVHLAWNQANSNFRQSYENLNWLNVSTRLLYLFDKYVKSDNKKFIFAGSSSEYDGENGVFCENDDIIPASIYGLSKKTFNKYADEYCKKRGISYVGMRLFTIYGEEDDHEFGAIPSAISKLIKGEELVCNSPQTTRDYIYADDAASVVCGLMERTTFTGIINVASGKPRSMEDVFRCIGRAMNKEDKVHMNKDNLCESRFEANVDLLGHLGLILRKNTFEENIDKIVRYKMKSIQTGCGGNLWNMI